MNGRIDICGSQHMIGYFCQCIDAECKKILKTCTDHVESQVKNSDHDSDKTWDGSIFSSKDTVNLLAADMFLAFFWLNNGLTAYFFNERETHISNGSIAVKTSFFFQLQHDMFQHFFFVLVKGKLLQDQRVSFDGFACCKTYRKFCTPGVIFNQMDHSVDAAMNGTIIVILITKILSGRAFLIFCNMKGMADKLIHTFIFCSGDRDDRYTE